VEGKITSISLVVSDQQRSLEFYTEQAGFEKRTDVTGPGGYRYVTVSPKGEALEVALWQRGSAVNPEQKDMAMAWAAAKAPPVVIQVSDCRAIHEAMAARGVRFLQPPFDHPWGVSATFADPDGNLFSLSQPKGWGTARA
jgi:predicted enzyme related to lactoylglutathione lyase